MDTLDDRELLREYVARGSDEAFAALVSRHVNLVYSVAWRHTGNAHAAEEITQAVFVVLARKAGSLRPGTVVAGWLFHAARLTASNFLRTEIRRTRREQEAYMQSSLDETGGDDTWKQIAPLLDRAIASLGETDRNAIVLRFLEGKDLKQVGVALGTGEEAAKKRVSRAVEKLRKFFTGRGVLLSGAALTAGLAANSAQAAPAGLATSAAALAAAKGTTAGASTLALIKGTIKLMTMAKIKMAALAGAAVLLVVGGGITIAQVGQRPATMASTDGISAAELIKRVKDKYISLTSYRDTGTTVQEGYGFPVNGTFETRLGRPNFYRVVAHLQYLTCAAWSTGEGDFTMPLTGGRKYFKETNSVRALRTSQAEVEIGILFFGGNDFILDGRDVSRGDDEKVGGVDCRSIIKTILYRNSTGITGTNTITILVGKDDDLIRQYRSIEKNLATAGGTPASTRLIITHENISTNEPVKKEDFAYRVPEGTVLSELPKPAAASPR